MTRIEPHDTGTGVAYNNEMPSKKTPKQLDQDIERALLNAKVTSRHSAKALTTLARMHTTPSQWQLTPIEWVEEEREVPGLVRCPTCHGRKYVRTEGGAVIPPPPANSSESVAYDNEARREAFRANRPYGNCPTCGKRKAGWGVIPQGKIKGMVRAIVPVGYPQFPPGTRFDSQYGGSGHHCQLCNKWIMKSGRVPVHATGDDGITHGMFVGEDCAKKFLNVKIKRHADAIMESGNAGLASK
jgi:ssDNA-binding Zn-finger/Zn-ribbon topoisomerase 1